jgi:hypothetical protein
MSREEVFYHNGGSAVNSYSPAGPGNFFLFTGRREAPNGELNVKDW